MSNDNWEPGDLALCVRGGHIKGLYYNELPRCPEYPQVGKIYKVENIDYSLFCTGPATALRLEKGPLNLCGLPIWSEIRFVKITPGTEIKGKEAENKVPVSDRILEPVG